MASRATALDHAAAVQTLFDRKSAGWPAKYAADGRLVGRLAQFTDVVRDLTAAGGELLDLGCGSGELARLLAARGYRVTGCDIAPLMLRRAAEADPGRAVRWTRLEPGWRTLPFAAGSLDAVVAASVLEYTRDPGAVFGECARVLRPGGVLLCSVPDIAHPVRWLEWPLRLVARTWLSRLAPTAPHRSGLYLDYLRASGQPRRLRWWQAAGRQAGLEPLWVPRTPRRPLRLLAFVRPGRAPGASSTS